MRAALHQGIKDGSSFTSATTEKSSSAPYGRIVCSSWRGMIAPSSLHLHELIHRDQRMIEIGHDDHRPQDDETADLKANKIASIVGAPITAKQPLQMLPRTGLVADEMSRQTYHMLATYPIVRICARRRQITQSHPEGQRDVV